MRKLYADRAEGYWKIYIKNMQIIESKIFSSFRVARQKSTNEEKYKMFPKVLISF